MNDAPVVLQEHAAAYFDLPGASRFMQFAAPVRPERASRVPAEQALASFRRMPLHALAMPPYLVRKRIEPELPE